MGDATIEGIAGLVVGLLYLLDHRGWPLIDPLSWWTIYLIGADYTKATTNDGINAMIGAAGHL